MSDTLIATIGGLWALIFWGVGDWLLAKSSKKGNVFEVNAAFNLPGVFATSAIFFISSQHINNWHNIWIICIASLLFFVAFLAFIRAFFKGAIGLVTPIASTYPVFTLISSAIFVSIALSHLQVLAMVITTTGVIILAYEKRNKKIPLRIQHQAAILALAAAVLWGVGNTVQNSVISKETWVVVLLFIEIPIAIASVLALLVGQKPLDERFSLMKRDIGPWIAGAIYSFGSFGFYYTSVKVGSVLIPLIVASANPIISSGLGAYYDHEKLGWLKRVGAVTAVAGIILINL